MKNIHVLPTDQLSSLRLGDNGNFVFGLTQSAIVSKNDSYTNQYIYITNSEEIKPNVYCLINGVLCKTELLEDKIVSRQLVGGATMDICKSEYSEIILTTNQDLIKDGVQAINDEFLEWFVKNPSCERVETKIEFIQTPDNLKDGFYYKIIIPTEEHKQETLEEAAEKIRKELIHAPIGIIPNFKDGFIAGAKWQAKRMYSEEDLREAFKQSRQAKIFEKDMPPVYENFQQWFEQFKKKQSGE